MKPQFDVPFLPDDEYVEFLQDCVDDLDSVHFSLLPDAKLDSRILLETANSSGQDFELLARLKGPRKYALMNSRFYLPALLANKENIKPIVKALEQCLEKDIISGIIYCDHYFLQHLSNQVPDIASSLEAVPGVNTMLDSFSKVEAQLSYIGETRFKLPGKIMLDRSLNRDLDRLAKVTLQLHAQFPDIKLELLANEGCLPYCPFKLSHDSYIALANIHGLDNTYRLNCDIGCMKLIDEQPYRILLSPFIRPEDIDLYFYHIDTIKLCGRTLGPGFLRRALEAYRSRQYSGNLLELLDATNWLAEQLYIDNDSLSFDFANMLSLCDGRCDKCGFCKELFDTVARPLPVSLPDRRLAVD